MTPTWATCARCELALYPSRARRTDVGFIHVACPSRRTLDRTARLEDVRWMAATGENLTGAAARLGLSVSNLDRWLRRHDPATLVVLRTAEPRDHNNASIETMRAARWAS